MTALLGLCILFLGAIFAGRITKKITYLHIMLLLFIALLQVGIVVLHLFTMEPPQP